MAVDEAILEASGGGLVPPTLRLYAWSPPCLSLGYAQPYADVNQAILSQRSWEVVRRPTGGRAILHTDELTYSVAGPQAEPRLAGSVLESYRVLAQALLYALQLLAIPAQAQEKAGTASTGSPNQNPVCFEVPSNYEITVDGKKLIGSAQARRKEGVLQHGSLPLAGDLTRIADALVFAEESARRQAAARLRSRATTVEAVLGHAVTWDAAAQAVRTGFEMELGLRFTPMPLNGSEQRSAQVLVRDKYAHPSWTERV